jgi:hypothetical protein
MKNPESVILGSLDLQITFRIPGSKTLYRVLTHPPRPVTPYYGKRDCLNLETNKAEPLACNRQVIIPIISELSESKKIIHNFTVDGKSQDHTEEESPEVS